MNRPTDRSLTGSLTGPQTGSLTGLYTVDKGETQYQECGSMLFSNKKTVLKNEQKKEMRELRRQIEISRIAIQSAQSQFEQVVDPTLIDCYIYELNAAQLRYQFLLRSFKKRELQEV